MGEEEVRGVEMEKKKYRKWNAVVGGGFPMVNDGVLYCFFLCVCVCS